MRGERRSSLSESLLFAFGVGPRASASEYPALRCASRQRTAGQAILLCPLASLYSCSASLGGRPCFESTQIKTGQAMLLLPSASVSSRRASLREGKDPSASPSAFVARRGSSPRGVARLDLCHDPEEASSSAASARTVDVIKHEKKAAGEALKGHSGTHVHEGNGAGVCGSSAGEDDCSPSAGQHQQQQQEQQQEQMQQQEQQKLSACCDVLRSTGGGHGQGHPVADMMATASLEGHTSSEEILDAEDALSVEANAEVSLVRSGTGLKLEPEEDLADVGWTTNSSAQRGLEPEEGLAETVKTTSSSAPRKLEPEEGAAELDRATSLSDRRGLGHEEGLSEMERATSSSARRRLEATRSLLEATQDRLEATRSRLQSRRVHSLPHLRPNPATSATTSAATSAMTRVPQRRRSHSVSSHKGLDLSRIHAPEGSFRQHKEVDEVLKWRKEQVLETNRTSQGLQGFWMDRLRKQEGPVSVHSSQEDLEDWRPLPGPQILQAFDENAVAPTYTRPDQHQDLNCGHVCSTTELHPSLPLASQPARLQQKDTARVLEGLLLKLEKWQQVRKEEASPQHSRKREGQSKQQEAGAIQLKNKQSKSRTQMHLEDCAAVQALMQKIKQNQELCRAIIEATARPGTRQGTANVSESGVSLICNEA